MDTRLGLRSRPETPGVVEAIAAYVSEPAWRRKQQPTVEPEADLSAAEALVQLPRPYLLPPADTNEFDALRQVIELAQDPEFVKSRHRYFEWFRDFIEPLRTADTTDLAEIHLDPSSLALAEQNLRALFEEELAVVRQGDRAKWFTHGEVACVSAGTAGSVGLALAAALPAVGIPVAILTFAGWALARHAKPQPPRSLGGAAMFVDAQRQLDWPTAST